MKTIKQKSFLIEKWMHRKFSFEIVSKNKGPAKINGALKISILVGGDSYSQS